MIISLPKTVRRLYFMIMFIALSFLLYHVMNLIGAWILPVKDSKIPEGSAVRAFHDSGYRDGSMSAGQRLRLYYWYGE